MLGKIIHLQVIPQQSTQMKGIWGYRHTRKPVNLFTDVARAPTLSPAIILQTQVPLQKFPFRQKLYFLDVNLAQ